jgi:hypothetical protein
MTITLSILQHSINLGIFLIVILLLDSLLTLYKLRSQGRVRREFREKRKPQKMEKGWTRKRYNMMFINK